MFDYYYLYPVVVCISMQLIKVCIDVFFQKKINFKILFAPWWFPSVHSTLASSVFTIVVLVDWFSSTLAMVTLMFSFLWRYDAMSVRYEAGKHAEYLNLIAKKIWYKPSSKFTERIWHTTIEVVAWIVLWFVMTILLYDYSLFFRIFEIILQNFSKII